MTANLLVDSNVLVYAYDRSEPENQRQALPVLTRLADTGTRVLTTQVLSEFFNTVTRKLPCPLSPTDAAARLYNFLIIWPVIELTGAIILEATRGVNDHQLNFWDAQIWAAAKLSGVDVVLSEDFNVGAEIEGVRFVNPFAADFDLDHFA